MNFVVKHRFIAVVVLLIGTGGVLWYLSGPGLDHTPPAGKPQNVPQDMVLANDTIIRPGDILTSTGVPLRYYLASNKRRYTFPNDATFDSWYPANTPVHQIDKNILQTYLLAGNVTERPGVRVVKFISDPKFYVVSSGAVLHAANENLLRSYYGSSWQERVDMIEEWYRIDYTIGSDLNSLHDYSPWQEFQKSPTISHDRGVAPKGTP